MLEIQQIENGSDTRMTTSAATAYQIRGATRTPPIPLAEGMGHHQPPLYFGTRVSGFDEAAQDDQNRTEIAENWIVRRSGA